MDVSDLLGELSRRGVRLVTDGEHLRFKPREAVTMELLEELRQHKGDIITQLRPHQKAKAPPRYQNPPECSNSFTPHSEHEFPWECDPNSCYCFQQYGYPHFCQGAPCRWVWPEHTDEKKCHQLES